MTVDELYILFQYAINKNQNGGLSSGDFNSAINLGQDSWVEYLAGDFSTYQPGRPISKVELGQNSVVRQRLSPVIYGYILSVDNTGFAPYPLDYIQTDSMWGIYGNTRVRWADQTRWTAMYNSVIDPIATNPIYLIKDKGFEFAPKTIGQAKMSYVRLPPRIKWGYNIDVNGREVYSPINSLDPIWDNITILEIIVRALKIIGVNLQLSVVMQYAQDIKNNGQ